MFKTRFQNQIFKIAKVCEKTVSKYRLYANNNNNNVVKI